MDPASGGRAGGCPGGFPGRFPREISPGGFPWRFPREVFREVFPGAFTRHFDARGVPRKYFGNPVPGDVHNLGARRNLPEAVRFPGGFPGRFCWRFFWDFVAPRFWPGPPWRCLDPASGGFPGRFSGMFPREVAGRFPREVLLEVFPEVFPEACAQHFDAGSFH